MTSLKAADAKEVASSVSVIANEKLKVEKEAAGKKKTGKGFSVTDLVFMVHNKLPYVCTYDA
jgi:hypothetical protein